MDSVVLNACDLLTLSKFLDGSFSLMTKEIQIEYAEKLRVMADGMDWDNVLISDGNSTILTKK